ncbi:MAG: protease modulator HflC [Proteobacteria bacterium]|nr:protease modulator HflC [Pseudomonadota bacterium]
MKKLLLILVVALAVAAYDGFYIVDEGEQSVITQFGEPKGEPKKEAGLYLKLPYIQRVHYFDKRILKWDGKPNEIPTQDKMYIWVDTTARWKIEDPLLFFQRMNNEQSADIRLGELINGAVRDFVTKNNLVEIIRSSDWDPTFKLTTETTQQQARVEIKVGRDMMSQIVLDQVSVTAKSFGIDLLDVLIKRINYTTEVRKTVYQRMISERQRIAERKRSEGQAEKARILGDMEKQLLDIESTAFKTAEQIRGQADARATEIYGEAYSRDPDFYAFLISLESYKSVMGDNTRLVIQADSPLYQYLQKAGIR